MSSGRLKTMSFTALLKAGVFDDDDRLAVAPDQAVEVTVDPRGSRANAGSRRVP